jgi:phosphoribosylformylglycinamidine synthase PurS subunit
MKFVAEINVMPHKALLDPQGKAVGNSLPNIGISNVSSVRIGKHITMELQAPTETEASQQVENACKNLLANLIMESYDYTLKEIK